MTIRTSARRVSNAREVFTGELDYANVTEFRESLLPAVSELERNPTKRYLVTKHGKPLAVFLSFEAFETVRKLVERLLAEQDQKSEAEIIREASERMDRDHGVDAAAQPQVLLTDINEQLEEIRKRVASVLQATNAIESQRAR